MLLLNYLTLLLGLQGWQKDTEAQKIIGIDKDNMEQLMILYEQTQ